MTFPRSGPFIGLALAAATFLASQQQAFAQSAAGKGVSQCDLLAGFDYAPRQAGVAGVYNVVETLAAIRACEAESAAAPDDPYLRLQLARAYLDANLDDPRGASLTQSVRDMLPSLATMRLGMLYDFGDGGMPQDTAQAMALYEESCAMEGQPGALVACTNLAVLLRGLGEPEADRRALGLLETGCEAGYQNACMNLGYEYELGEVVAEDAARAVSLYERACDGGDLMGCTNLGYALANGLGGRTDIDRALDLYRVGCELGEGESCNFLGEALADGTAGMENPGLATQVFGIACAEHFAHGCQNQGYHYLTGRGVTRDLTRAAGLFEMACAEDLGWSCRQLSEMLERGQGVRADPARSEALRLRACELGESTACTP